MKKKTRTRTRTATKTGTGEKALVSASGYRVVAAGKGGREQLTVQAPGGRMCLRILLLPEGPIVEVEGQALRLASSGEIRLDCEQLAINVRRDVALRAGGVIDSEGHAQRLRARLGDIELAANDDVSLDGERIRLNSPRSLPPQGRG